MPVHQVTRELDPRPPQSPPLARSASVVPEAPAQSIAIGFCPLEELLRSVRNPILPFNL
jgi:hypothetical protein